MKPDKSKDKNYEDWMNRKWRPLMGYTYMITCITDFIIFPVLWSIFKAYIGQGVEPWSPLTLQGAGLFHLAMGAVLGVAAWSRGKEKIVGANAYLSYPYQQPYDDYEYEYEQQSPTRSRRLNLRGKPIQGSHPEL